MWSTHKGQVLAHKTAEVRRSEQSTLVSLLSPFCGLSSPSCRVPTFTQSWETAGKTAADSLTLGSTPSPQRRRVCEPRCGFCLTPPSSFRPLTASGKEPSVTAATGCVAGDDWIYPVLGGQCGPGAAQGSSLLKSSCGRLFTRCRHVSDLQGVEQGERSECLAVSEAGNVES